ncbi:MAG: hypothetical protein QM783_08400 [Phycisphaerales bacterium]
MNGFVRLAALGLVAASPLIVLTAGGAGQPPAPPAQTPPPPAADPADTIKRMEEQRRKDNPAAPAPANPAAPRPPAGAPEQPAAEPATTGTRLLRENTFITQRRGRMTRSMTNEWVFTMDADAKGTRAEPAMVLMPCLNLQNMEKAVERSGDGTSFTISGTVYVYKGRNYLLPSMFVVNRRGDLAPAQ